MRHPLEDGLTRSIYNGLEVKSPKKRLELAVKISKSWKSDKWKQVVELYRSQDPKKYAGEVEIIDTQYGVSIIKKREQPYTKIVIEPIEGFKFKWDINRPLYLYAISSSLVGISQKVDERWKDKAWKTFIVDLQKAPTIQLGKEKTGGELYFMLPDEIADFYGIGNLIPSISYWGKKIQTAYLHLHTNITPIVEVEK